MRPGSRGLRRKESRQKNLDHRVRISASTSSGLSSERDAWPTAKFERAWGRELDPEPGLTVVEITHGALEGRIRGMYIMGENPFLSDPNVNKVREAGHDLPARVSGVQEMFARLPPAARAHVMANVQRETGMSYEEMAQAMECSKGTIMSRLFHARKNMQKLLGERLGPVEVPEHTRGVSRRLLPASPSENV